MSRIKYVSDEEVTISIDGLCKMTLKTQGGHGGHFQILGSPALFWDPDGVAALAEATRRLSEEGSFKYFKPKPVYRPYTPVEAVAHLGGWFRRKDWPRSGVGRPIRKMSQDGIYDDIGCLWPWDLLASDCCWVDSGKPCGILVEG